MTCFHAWLGLAYPICDRRMNPNIRVVSTSYRHPRGDGRAAIDADVLYSARQREVASLLPRAETNAAWQV